jgi:N-methylhydantoinase B/oxoprolinase/acetone carboxylase alpha subunit
MHNDAVDPITLEVLRNRLEAIAQEMQDALVRSAYSNIIKEGHDCSAALFNAGGEVIAQATALPAQLGVLPTAVKRMIKLFTGKLLDGDVLAVNDPYDGGTHLPDICLIAPIVMNGTVAAYAACIAHHQDIGGKTPGSLPTDATEIFQEGLRIPPIKLYERGARNETAFAFIARNVRLPEITAGDLSAQLASLHVGKIRLTALLELQGAEAFTTYMDVLLDRAERVTRQFIATIKPGAYVFEDYLDDDGIDRTTLVRIRTTVSVKGSDLDIDFAGSSPQLTGPLNADRAALMSAVYFAVKSITDPMGPTNGGSFRPIRLHLPEASVVNPRAPAPVNARTHTMKRIVDSLLGAMVQAMPGRIPAAPCGSVRVAIFSGLGDGGEPYMCSDFSTGGTGAQPERDGIDCLETDIANTMNMPAESLELNYPIRVLSYRLWIDSAGAGRRRGGLGVEREIEILRGRVTMTLREDRHRTQPWGLFGGRPAPLAIAEIKRANGEYHVIPSKGVYGLSAGDRVRCRVSGGAGYGDPLQRDPLCVREDVIDSKVSLATARDSYGVVLRADFSLDAASTEAQRTKIGNSRGDITWIYDRGGLGLE